jgi:penicillin amidase
MKRILGLITLLVGLLLLFLLQKDWRMGSTPVPPLGNVLNPFSGVWQNAESLEDYEDFNLKSDSVAQPVSIVFDERMVPHIYASNLKDAMFAQGYVEAYHRLFQMDIATRAPDGRLSEVFGEVALEYDKKQRRLGLNWAADNAVKGWKKHPEELSLVESYVNGINHRINQLDAAELPIEYKLLNFKPESWNIRKCALFLKAMSQTLAGYEEDIEMSNALKLLGEKDFKAIYPAYSLNEIPVIREQDKKAKPRKKDEFIAQFPYIGAITRPRSPEGVGSNSWAVNPNKTATGSAMLANDPHLGLSLPSVWYELAITTPEFSAHGATLLGMPGIMIGFNQSIAWGETNAGHDVMDYFQIEWVDSAKTAYWLDGKKIPIAYHIEKIKLKNGQEITDSIPYTYWGPIVDNDKDLALHWLAHDEAPGREFLTFIHGMKSKNYDEYLEATSEFYCPAQNFTYADTSGTVAIRVNGNLPIRSPEMSGRSITPGNLSKYAWTGFIPRNENPQERNPKRNYVMSANQHSASKDYAYAYVGKFEQFRNRIADSYLKDSNSLTIDDMKAMQLSSYSLEAEEALRVMLPLLDSNSHKQEAYRLLANWDFNYTAESKAASFFTQWFESLKTYIWDEVLLYTDSIALPTPSNWVTTQLLNNDPKSKFYDRVETTKQETLKDLVTLSFRETLKDTVALKPWASVKQTRVPHLIKIEPFGQDVEVGGYKYALNAMKEEFGPSWRMIVDLSSVPKAYCIYPGGQSGNPASPFYKNMIESWAEGQYHAVELAPKPADIKKPLFTITISNEE